MTIDPRLMYAILSMDAYNRGYDAGIQIAEPENPVDQQLGSARIITTSSALVDGNGNPNIDDDIGFYAIAYTYNGETIISFRGTNDKPTLFNPITDDMYHGWSLGGGNTDSEQGQMAIKFYQAVAGSGNWLSADISLTGHSLGGGLAGYVGALYDQDAEVFDSMTFQLAASNTSNSTVTLWDGTTNYQYVGIKPSEVGTYTPPSGWTVTNIEANASTELADLVYGASASPWDQDLNGISGHYIEGEVLESMLPLRGGGAFSQ